MAGNESVFLFTSAPDNRPQYTLDFLTCLASPVGHRVTFSYKREWLADDIFDANLAGRSGCVVFCEPDSVADDMSFHPLRQVEIISFGPPEIVSKRLAKGETRLAITFRLGRLLHASPNTIADLVDGATKEIRALSLRPYPRGLGGDASRWVILGRHQEPAAAVTPQTAWLAHAEHLDACHSLKDALLFQVSRPQKLDWRRRPKEIAIGSDHLLGDAYKLRSRRQYKLEVSFFLRLGADPKDLVRTDVSSDRIRRTAPISTALGEESRATVFFGAEALAADELATVTVQGPEGLPGESSPTVAFIVRFRPVWIRIAVGWILIAFGVLIGGFSADDWKQLSLELSFHQTLLIKLAGAFIAGFGGFYAFRNQPGGS